MSLLLVNGTPVPRNPRCQSAVTTVFAQDAAEQREWEGESRQPWIVWPWVFRMPHPMERSRGRFTGYPMVGNANGSSSELRHAFD